MGNLGKRVTDLEQSNGTGDYESAVVELSWGGPEDPPTRYIIDGEPVSRSEFRRRVGPNFWKPPTQLVWSDGAAVTDP